MNSSCALPPLSWTWRVSVNHPPTPFPLEEGERSWMHSHPSESSSASNCLFGVGRWVGGWVGGWID